MTDEKMAADGTAVERYAGNLTEEYRPRILMAPAEARALDDALRENMRAVLREGVDYGVIPGTGNKPALLKPGAEKLLQWFGFGHAMERTEIDTDDSGHRLGATYRCTVTKGLPDGRQAVIGMCEGYAGYDEDRFYTSAEQAEAKERANAARYKRSVNTSKFTSYRAPWNSVIKMAQKRAMVGAALQATSASSLFTQDVEDNSPSSPPQWLPGTRCAHCQNRCSGTWPSGRASSDGAAQTPGRLAVVRGAVYAGISAGRCPSPRPQKPPGRRRRHWRHRLPGQHGHGLMRHSSEPPPLPPRRTARNSGGRPRPGMPPANAPATTGQQSRDSSPPAWPTWKPTSWKASSSPAWTPRTRGTTRSCR